MKKFAQEFKEFISRGNVMDMAIGVVMGTAFTAIINAVVNGVLMPIIGFILGGNQYDNIKIVLAAAKGDKPEVAIAIGTVLGAIINFLIIAAVLFCVVKVINRFRKKQEEEIIEEPAPEVPADIALLTEIRDLLKK